MKNILLLVHEDEGQEARLQAALNVVRALDGHLRCIDVVQLPEPSPELWDAGAGSAMLLAEERARESVNRQTLEIRLARDDVPWSWIDMAGSPARCVRTASGLADLIVVSRDPGGTASDLIVESGKPVLVVPDAAAAKYAGSRVLIAWDGSPQAERALQAAVPLLRRADHVMILQVDDGSIQTPVGEAATFLSRHDIHPLVILEKSAKGGAEDILLTEISRRGADYVVMGGFGRSRLSETLFGGVSRRLLSDSPIALLMVH